MQYTDIALAAVLCSIAQVPMVKTTMTPHLIGGKTLHRSLEFFYSLTCKGRLWAITSPIRIMFTSSQWRSKKPTRVATTLVYICDRACDNRACGHMIFVYFFTLSSLITFCTIMLWCCNFQHLVSISLA